MAQVPHCQKNQQQQHIGIWRDFMEARFTFFSLSLSLYHLVLFNNLNCLVNGMSCCLMN